jgi:hypothetical protein
MSSQFPLSSPLEHSAVRIGELSEYYRRAQRSYVYASVLLASWELMGITLDTRNKWGLKLENPKAIPSLLFAVVLYCCYKMVIEWLQCGAERGTRAKIRFWVAHLAASGSIVIYVFQHWANVQIADALEGMPGNPIYWMAFVGAVIGLVFWGTEY